MNRYSRPKIHNETQLLLSFFVFCFLFLGIVGFFGFCFFVLKTLCIFGEKGLREGISSLTERKQARLDNQALPS